MSARGGLLDGKVALVTGEARGQGRSHPWGVVTPMVEDSYTATMLTEHPNYVVSFGSALPSIVMADPNDISDAVGWLSSDRSRTVTGTQVTLDTGDQVVDLLDQTS